MQLITLINFSYLIAALLFIFGLKGLTHPRTAVRGNLVGASGMFLAVATTLFNRQILTFELILAGVVIGALIGGVFAVRIAMTAMPQLVALFNGFGGGASVLVAGAALIESILRQDDLTTQFKVATTISGFIGAVTFAGSVFAFAKLQELISGRPLIFPGQRLLNILLVVASFVVGIWIIVDPSTPHGYWVLVACCLVLGVTVVLPVGGADMPVVIALLNSFSGLAASATGFVLENNILIIAGALVGASGLILTQIMCRAMNRSIGNVLFAGVGIETDSESGDAAYEGKIKVTSADEVAMVFEASRRVVVVPGYGMAVAQAQYAVRDLSDLLAKRGVEVEYAIHPVAGRMPGHMNVLLAEAEVPYDQLKEMDLINSTFEQTDVVLVIGANDVVNPLGRVNDSGPLGGMPILDVDKARTVVVIKRSLSPGFAGIANPLFAADNTLMYFSNAKEAVLDLVAAVKGTG